MIQNIKVDVIYYMGSKDFEMEFNLCGCCRMRLLTDQVKDHKSFIHALSRAVTRSRVIMCVGPLFGEEGLIQNVSAAVRIPLEDVENEKYGIRSNSRIEIIKGSLPLVTADGIFGGCIVESGPQSIILLSESKSVRKSLMTSLIHPYMEEISIASSTINSQAPDADAEDDDNATVQSTVAAESVPFEAEVEVVGTIAAVSSAEDDSIDIFSSTVAAGVPADEENAAEALENVIIGEDNDTNKEIPEPQSEDGVDENGLEDSPADGEATAETQGEGEDANSGEAQPSVEPLPKKIDLYIEPQRVKFSKKNYYDTHYDYGEQSELYYADTEDDDVPRRRSLRVPVLIFTVILLLAVLVLVYLLVFVPMREGYSISQYVETLFEPAAIFTGILGG